MYKTNVDKKIITYALISIPSLLILFRSITRPISDYDSYRLTGGLILNELTNQATKFSYDPSWGNFESRSGNGPIWNLFLSPFLIVPYTPAIIIFRFIVILALFLLVKKITFELNVNNNLIILSFIIMLFPSRFLVNTSQGSSIAYLIGVCILISILKRNPSNREIFLIGLGAIIGLNYKPHLFIPFVLWILINKKIKIIFSIFLVGIALEILLFFTVSNSTQLAWLKYLLSRSDHIDRTNFPKYGPLSFFYEFFNFSTTWVYVTSLILLLLMGFYFYISAYDFKSGLVAMSLGVFIGPYSPTHDQILIAVIFGIIFFQYITKDKFIIFLFIPLLFWIYPSEYTILKQVILFLVYAVIILSQSNLKNFFIFIVLFLITQRVILGWLYTDAIYLITNLGALFTLPFLSRFQNLSLQYKNL